MSDDHGPDAPDESYKDSPGYKLRTKVVSDWISKLPVYEPRQYLPTLADLIDRLSIVTLKEIYIPENRDAYRVEREMIKHDIDLLLTGYSSHTVIANPAEFIRACMICMLANRVIWESESKARAGGSEQDHLLKFSHSVNGVRATAKNVIAKTFGERVDLKVDALAADLPIEFGNWGIF